MDGCEEMTGYEYYRKEQHSTTTGDSKRLKRHEWLKHRSLDWSDTVQTSASDQAAIFRLPRVTTTAIHQAMISGDPAIALDSHRDFHLVSMIQV